MDSLKTSFFGLDASKVADWVEAAMSQEKNGARATGRVIALNSLENRVYEVEFDDETSVVAKFYRPGRWTMDQILDEHEFLDRLEEAEVPVVTAFSLVAKKGVELTEADTLAKCSEGICFAVFPKVRGRLRDELSEKQLETLGRFLARIHQVGRHWHPEHRWQIISEEYLSKPLKVLADCPQMDQAIWPHYHRVAEAILSKAREKLKTVELIATHGDCHLGNTLWNEESPFLLDFDDSILAPAVQDVWMIIRGRDDQAQKDREALFRGYEQMQEFDYSQLSLIESLRGVRIIYYSAWIARRWEDPSFPNAFPHFTRQEYWRSELDALNEINELIDQGK